MKKIIFCTFLFMFVALMVMPSNAASDANAIMTEEVTRQYSGSIVWLKTPADNDVYAIDRSDGDWSQAEIEAKREEAEASYPGVTVVGNATKKYNCHYYAWATHWEQRITLKTERSRL